MAVGPGRWPRSCSDSGSGSGKLALSPSPLAKDAGAPPVPASDVLLPLETRGVELRLGRARGSWGGRFQLDVAGREVSIRASPEMHAGTRSCAHWILYWRSGHCLGFTQRQLGKPTGPSRVASSHRSPPPPLQTVLLLPTAQLSPSPSTWGKAGVASPRHAGRRALCASMRGTDLCAAGYVGKPPPGAKSPRSASSTVH